MDELIELIEEAKRSSGCRVEKEGEFYHIFAEEIITIQECIDYIEVEGYRVFVHRGPEVIENTMFYGIVTEVVHKDKVSEEERSSYKVIYGVEYD